MESDLESFRQQWHQEILQQNQSSRNVNISTIARIENSSYPSKEEPSIPLTTSLKEDGIVNSFRNMSLGLSPINSSKKFHISKLPNELIICIIKQLILNGDVSSLEIGFALVCKKFFLLSREISLWRLLCEKIYCEDINNRNDLNRLFQECVNKYGSDWRRMYIERPRVRFDGIYISTCKYLRPGLAEGTCIRPTHLVIYYRYLRFFPDGSCIALLTTKEPTQEIVKNFDKFIHTLKIPKNFMFGNWKFINDDDISKRNKLFIYANDSYSTKFNFHLKLDLKSTSLGKFNKLSWIEYNSINKLTNEETNMLTNESNYYFSKVKSYNVNL